MEKMSDEVLLEELKNRFEENKKALYDLKMMTQKLEDLNRKLADSEAVKSNFLSNIRNEINNPLASILGISRQIMIEDVSAKTAKEMAELIHKEAFYLHYQLCNIFQAAEIEAGEATLSISLVDIPHLVENIIDSFQQMAQDKGLTISVDYSHNGQGKEDLLFLTDPQKLEIVMSNLVGNAIEFSNKGKTVLIKVWRKGEYLHITIEDDGTGISPELREKIYERFTQLDSGTTKKHRGHGLGLSVVKALLQMMGSQIVFSCQEGKPCVFEAQIREADRESVTDMYSEEGNEFMFDSEEKF